MTDEPTNIILERLNRMEKSMQDEFGTLKEAIRRPDARTSSTSHFLSAFHSTTNFLEDEITELRGRIEVLESQADRPDA